MLSSCIILPSRDSFEQIFQQVNLLCSQKTFDFYLSGDTGMFLWLLNLLCPFSHNHVFFSSSQNSQYIVYRPFQANNLCVTGWLCVYLRNSGLENVKEPSRKWKNRCFTLKNKNLQSFAIRRRKSKCTSKCERVDFCAHGLDILGFFARVGQKQASLRLHQKKIMGYGRRPDRKKAGYGSYVYPSGSPASNRLLSDHCTHLYNNDLPNHERAHS